MRHTLKSFYVKEGTTVDLNYQLLNNAAAQDLTGKTIAIRMTDKQGRPVNPGTISVVDAATGKVKIEPTANVWRLDRAPFYGSFEVTDSSGKVAYWPNGNLVLEWNIIRP